MKLGVCAEPEKSELLRSLGYDFIELPGAVIASLSDAEAKERAARLALPAIGFNAISSGSPAFVGPDFDEAKVSDYAERLSERGALFNIRSIGVGAPKARILPAGFDRKTADAQMELTLRAFCKAAAKRGQYVLYEALNRDIANYGNSTEEAFDTVTRLALPNLGLVLDFYQMKRLGEDCTDITRYISLTQHLHISHYGEKRGFLVEEGRDFYAAAVNAARRAGYDGTLSIESPSDDLALDAARSKAILDKILA